jgi:hypothetical protein
MRGDGPHQIHEQTILGHLHGHRFQHRDSNGASPTLPHPHHENQGNKNQGHSFFKHQYITNPQVSPKTLIIKAALDLTSALKGTVSHNGKTAEALHKFSELFTKIAAGASELAKAKEKQNNL